MLNWLVATFDQRLPAPVKRAIKTVLPSSSIYRAVKFLTPYREREVRIRSGPLAGRPFRCVLKYQRNYWLGTHEPEIERLLAEWLGEGDRFYDCGAHKGYFSLIGALRVGATGRVFAFEANPANYRAAQANLALNPDLGSRVELHHLAVSDKSATARFKGRPHASTGRMVRHDQPGAAIEVPSIALDDFVGRAKPPPSVGKMDIEGGEQWALQGMTMILSVHRPKMVTEVHDSAAFAVLSSVAREYRYELLTLAGDPAGERWTTRQHFLVVPH